MPYTSRIPRKATYASKPSLRARITALKDEIEAYKDPFAVNLNDYSFVVAEAIAAHHRSNSPSKFNYTKLGLSLLIVPKQGGESRLVNLKYGFEVEILDEMEEHLWTRHSFDLSRLPRIAAINHFLLV